MTGAPAAPAVPARARADVPEPAAVRPDDRAGQRARRARPVVDVGSVAVPAAGRSGSCATERRLRARADELLDAVRAHRLRRRGAERRCPTASSAGSRSRGRWRPSPGCCSSTSRPPGLNGQEVGQLSEIVRSIRDSGVTVVLIEHNMGLVMSLCDRVTVLASGGVIADGTPAEVAVAPGGDRGLPRRLDEHVRTIAAEVATEVTTMTSRRSRRTSWSSSGLSVHYGGVRAVSVGELHRRRPASASASSAPTAPARRPR